MSHFMVFNKIQPIRITATPLYYTSSLQIHWYNYLAPPEHNAARLSPLEKQPEQSDLLNQVATKVTDKWKNLGLQLEIEPDKVETISKENQGDSLLCWC